MKVEPVGKWFEKFQLSKVSEFHDHLLGEITNLEDDDEELSVEIELEDNFDYLKKLDPKDWKVVTIYSTFM